MGNIDRSMGLEGNMQAMKAGPIGHEQVKTQKALNEGTVDEQTQKPSKKIDHPQDNGRGNKDLSATERHVDIKVDGIKDLTRGSFI